MALFDNLFKKPATKPNSAKSHSRASNHSKPKINNKIKVSKSRSISKKAIKKEKPKKIIKTAAAKISTKNDDVCSSKMEFIKTYVPGFDPLLKQGIPVGSAVLVEGGPGSGKTLFCLTLLRELCKRGKKVLYMSFEEPEYRLRCHIKDLGANVSEFEKKGLLYIKRFNALDIARSVEALLSEAKKELLIDVQPVLIPSDFQADVVLIDSLTSISSAFSGESSRFRIYMEQLFRYLEAHRITSFLIREVANPAHVGGTFVEEGEAVSFLSDGIITIYNVIFSNGIRKRAIEVLKMRGTEVNRKIVECDISKKGIIVYPNKLLTGNFKLT